MFSKFLPFSIIILYMYTSYASAAKYKFIAYKVLLKFLNK